jgi:tetratricopeptide (TPR) repeat protein
MILAVSGFGSSAATIARRLAEVPGAPPRRARNAVLAAGSLAGAGRLAEAREELVRLRAYAPSLAAEHRAALAIGPLGPSRGELVAALDELTTVSPYAGDPSTWGYDRMTIPPVRSYLQGMLNHRLGEREQALAYADRLERWRGGTPAHARFADACAAMIRASVLASEDRPEEALRILGDARPLWGSGIPGLGQHPLAQARWLRAELLREVGRDADAMRWYASTPDPAGYDIRFLVPSLLRRAAILERLGERDEAAHAYRRVLEMWRGAGPEARPWLEQAREGLGRVRTRPG